MKIKLLLSERAILGDAQWAGAEKMQIVWCNGGDDDAGLARPCLQHRIDGNESFIGSAQLEDVPGDARCRDGCLNYWFGVHKIGLRVAAPNDRKLSDGGGLAQPVRAKTARVG